MKTKKEAEFATKICLETPAPNNPFLAQERYVMGYDVRELWQQSTFFDALLLHFLGDIPSPKHRQVFEMLFIGLMNLGPREVGSRTAMLAGLTKTRPEHLLPMGLLASQGARNGANEAELAHKYIRQNVGKPVDICITKGMAQIERTQLQHNTAHLIPGFGASYGEVDPIMQRLARDLFVLFDEAPVMAWCNTLVDELAAYQQGWLAPGLVAAVCIEVGVGAREAIGIYQLAKSVGIVAQAMEQTHFPISEAPFLSDKHYEREE